MNYYWLISKCSLSPVVPVSPSCMYFIFVLLYLSLCGCLVSYLFSSLYFEFLAIFLHIFVVFRFFLVFYFIVLMMLFVFLCIFQYYYLSIFCYC